MLLFLLAMCVPGVLAGDTYDSTAGYLDFRGAHANFGGKSHVYWVNGVWKYRDAPTTNDIMSKQFRLFAPTQTRTPVTKRQAADSACAGAFLGTSFNGDLNHWDVSECTNMAGMFYSASQFNGDISGWDVSGVIFVYGFEHMFAHATAFNRDISGWDLSGLKDPVLPGNMIYMFNYASTFNQPVRDWSVNVLQQTSSLGAVHVSNIFSGTSMTSRAVCGSWLSGTSYDNYCSGCHPGKYNIFNNGYSCEACAPGQFTSAHEDYEYQFWGFNSQTLVAATSCGLCAAGMYAPQASQGTCFTCPPGKVSEAGASECVSTCDKYTVGTACVPECLASTYLDGNECKTCPSGWRSTDAATECVQRCPVGTGRISAKKQFDMAVDDRKVCETCPLGWYSVEGNNNGGCVELVGTYPSQCKLVRGTSKCLYQCPAGTFEKMRFQNSILSSKQLGSTCWTCPDGEYQPTQGQTACLACPAGKTSSADHTQCVDCAAGTFAEEGFRVCEACAAGQISAAGASACVDPPPCTAGEGWVDGNCVPCDEGKDQHLLQHYEPCYDSPCKYLDVLREGCGATQ